MSRNGKSVHVLFSTKVKCFLLGIFILCNFLFVDSAIKQSTNEASGSFVLQSNLSFQTHHLSSYSKDDEKEKEEAGDKQTNKRRRDGDDINENSEKRNKEIEVVETLVPCYSTNTNSSVSPAIYFYVNQTTQHNTEHVESKDTTPTNDPSYIESKLEQLLLTPNIKNETYNMFLRRMNPLVQSLHKIIIDCKIEQYFEKFRILPCIYRVFARVYKDKHTERHYSNQCIRFNVPFLCQYLFESKEQFFNKVEECKEPLQIIKSFDWIYFLISTIALCTKESFRKEIYYIKAKLKRRNNLFNTLKDPTEGFNHFISIKASTNTSFIVEAGNNEVKLICDILNDMFFISYNKKIDSENKKKYAYVRMHVHTLFDNFRKNMVKLYFIVCKINDMNAQESETEYDHLKETLYDNLSEIENFIQSTQSSIERLLNEKCRTPQNLNQLLYRNIGTLMVKRLMIRSAHLINETVMTYLFQNIITTLEKFIAAFNLLDFSENENNVDQSMQEDKEILKLSVLYGEFHFYFSILVNLKSLTQCMFENMDAYIASRKPNEKYFNESAMVHFNITNEITRHYEMILNFIITIERKNNYAYNLLMIYNIMHEINQYITELKDIAIDLKFNLSDTVNCRQRGIFLCEQIYELYHTLMNIDPN